MRFSVLISVYAKDSPLLFERAINSIVDNSLPPNEIICVSDGPVPESIKSILKKYSEAGIIKWKPLDINIGLAGALNYGLKFVTNDWVFRADADDYNCKDRFKIQCNSIINTNADIVGGSIVEIDELGNKVALRETPENHRDIITFARKRNPFNHMTVAFKCQLAVSSGGYPNIYLKEDYAMWAQMIQKGARCYNIPEVLVEASAGDALYKRRGGFKYAKAEIKLQKFLVSCGIKSQFEAIIDGMVRSIAFLMPASFREILYRNILRKRWVFTRNV